MLSGPGAGTTVKEDHEEITILAVDDERDVVELTAEYLEREDERFTVVTETSASDGIERLAAADIDCVVSDYDMPRTNGLEFLQTVREEDSDLPFILFTGKGSEEIASDAISTGVTDYLQKGSGTERYELLANRIETAVSQYRTESQLERQNELFAKAQDIASVGAWEYDPQTEETYFSDEVYEIYGVGHDHDPSPEKDIQRFYHPEDCERIREAIGRAVESGEAYDIEARLAAADGTDKWVRTRADPYFADGEVVKVRGTIRDITDRKEQEQTLEKEREFIEQSLDTLDDIFYLVDTNGDFERWNSTLPERTGYTDDEIGSMNALEFFEGDHRTAIQTSIRTILETGSHVTEAEITTADRRTIPHEFRGVRMTDDDGNPTGIIGIARDITEHKQREERLIRQNEQLEELVGVVSHDLRNPLNVAESRLSLAAEECDSEHLTGAADAITRSQALIEDLLRLVREEQEVTEVERLGLADVAKDSWETVETGSARLNLDTTRVIHADRSRLQQLFENLYRNAVEHGGDGVTVDVGDTEIGFYVADTGPGIPESDRDEVFEAGYTTADDGTGFGLRIVEQIAEAHGWEIRVVDSPDGGARFEITGVEIVD
jgi:PAS domain S-box-containing protein